MNLAVCHKQIEKEWRQQIIVEAKHKFSNFKRIGLKNIGEQYVLDSLNLW